jgi:hypothetical protein
LDPILTSHDLIRGALVGLQPNDLSPRLYPKGHCENARCEHKVQDLQLTFKEGVPLMNGHPYFNNVQGRQEKHPLKIMDQQ